MDHATIAVERFNQGRPPPAESSLTVTASTKAMTVPSVRRCRWPRKSACR